MGDEKRVWTIYCHTCTVTGKKYVGQTVKTTEARWVAHVWDASRGRGCAALSRAIRKYGGHAWIHEVLATVSSRAEANALEIEWIGRLGSRSPGGYNLSNGGGVLPHPPEIHAKMVARVRAAQAAIPTAVRSARAAKYWAAYTPEQWAQHRKKMVDGWRAASPEQKAEAVRKRQAVYTPERASEARRKVWASRSPEARSAIAKKIAASFTTERRREIALQHAAAMSPEQRSENSRKANAAQTPEQRSEKGRRWHALQTPEQKQKRREVCIENNRRFTPEQRAAAGRKSSKTRFRKRFLKEVERLRCAAIVDPGYGC